MSLLSYILNVQPNAAIQASNAQREAYQQAAMNDIARGISIRSANSSLQQLMQVLPIQENEIDLESINTKEPKYAELKYGGVDG